ncbi:MAG: N-acyl-D-amino-acid deacylase family protein [Ostreibacterium sp.]
MEVDMIIRNGEIVDGTNCSAYFADIAIKSDKIIQIGDFAHVQAKRVWDARGKVVAPGFIDVHTHDDTYVIRQPDCLAKISQGVTTVIVGNCGISVSPAVLNAPPPDPMNLLGVQEDFNYPTFASYVQAVNAANPAVNVAALVGHTTLRNNVMEDLFVEATEEQIIKIQKMLYESMQQGALGLSTGLAYATANASSESEVQALAKILTQFKGIYTTHMRSESEGILTAMEEAFRVGQTAKIPIIISHLKCAGVGNWGRSKEVLDKIMSVLDKQDVACDCYPYSASSSTLDINQVTDEIDIFITWSDSLPEQAGKMLKTIAKELDLPLIETAKALQPAGAVYYCMNESDVEAIMQYPMTMIGSDGLPGHPHPHPRLWGTFPKVLGHYSREKNLFPLETAIYKMTGLSAEQFNLFDRGQIKENYHADLVVFDREKISDNADFDQPTAKAQGIDMVMVNGEISYTGKQGVIKRAGCFLSSQ